MIEAESCYKLITWKDAARHCGVPERYLAEPDKSRKRTEVPTTLDENHFVSHPRPRRMGGELEGGRSMTLQGIEDAA